MLDLVKVLIAIKRFRKMVPCKNCPCRINVVSKLAQGIWEFPESSVFVLAKLRLIWLATAAFSFFFFSLFLRKRGVLFCLLLGNVGYLELCFHGLSSLFFLFCIFLSDSRNVSSCALSFKAYVYFFNAGFIHIWYLYVIYYSQIVGILRVFCLV